LIGLEQAYILKSAKCIYLYHVNVNSKETASVV